jgi:hypothetical protein
MNGKEGALIAIVIILTAALGYVVLYTGSITTEERYISVIAEGYVKEDIDYAAVASCPVIIYDTPSPSVGSQSDIATSDSDGKFTLTVMVKAGSTIYAQARKAAPSSSDPYISPVVALNVPLAAENGDTLPIGTILVRDATATAPTFGVTDTGSAAISDNTQNYINTTDTRLNILLSAIDSDTWFGCEDFTDGLTGLSYWGAVFVWKGTVNQPFSGYSHVVNTPSNVFYIWKVTPFADKAAVSDDDWTSLSIAASSNLVADTTVVLYVYDVVDTAQMANGVFTTLTSVSSITTKVA